jgi:hypothetical protein
MFYFYSSQLHRQFTNRQRELAVLRYAVDELRHHRPHHIALFGLRRIGKTTLLKEFAYRLLVEGPVEQKDILPIYIDFEEICSSPESFALRYVGHISYWFQTQGEAMPTPYLNLNALLLNGPQAMKARLMALANELNKAKPDRGFLLHLAFNFAEELAQKAEVRFLIMLDEFQTIHTLANFPGARDVVAIFRAHLERQRFCGYVVAGSAISVMERMLAHTSPLFAQFERFTLAPLDKEDTQALVTKLLPLEDVEDMPAVIAEVQRLTGGHPFYIEVLCGQLRRWHFLRDRPLTPDSVKEAFIWEVLSPKGRIYDFCRYIYDVSIQKARGHGALVAILQLLAEEEGLTISEVARRQKVTPATARDYLRWLQDVDLIIEQDGKYHYHDPVLRLWVSNVTMGIEIAGPPRREILEEMVKHLDERYQRAATALDGAKESEVRELLRGLAGRTVSGELFGQEGTIHIPDFTQVKHYLSPDGQIELDALAESETERWVLEVKWRQKRVGKRELAQLLEQAKRFEAKAWCVSQAGFTPEAVAFAAERGILLSGTDDVKALEKTAGL